MVSLRVVILTIVLLLATVVSEVVRENRFEVLDLDDGKIPSKYVVSQPHGRGLRFRRFIKKIGKIAKVAVKVKAVAKTGGAAGAKMKAKAKVAKAKKAKAMKTKAKKMKSTMNKIKQVRVNFLNGRVGQLVDLSQTVNHTVNSVHTYRDFLLTFSSPLFPLE